MLKQRRHRFDNVLQLAIIIVEMCSIGFHSLGLAGKEGQKTSNPKIMMRVFLAQDHPSNPREADTPWTTAITDMLQSDISQAFQNNLHTQ